MPKTILGSFFISLVAVSNLLAQPATQLRAADVPQSKRTVLGLYVTAAQAHQRWKAAPDRVKIIDVRTPEEYLFVGHAAMTPNVPWMLLESAWDPGRNGPRMVPNPRFLTAMKRLAKPDDTLLLMCRSGGRSAVASNAMANAGFTKVYSVVDGFEGDTATDSDSPHLGKRKVNGWKNANLPWTYRLDPALVYKPIVE